MGSRLERIFNQYPEVVSGYELSPERSYFSIVLPEATTNLVINPSFELGTTGYSAYFASTLLKVSTYSTRGAFSCEITPPAGTDGGLYCSVALTAGVTYTFSVDIKDVIGQQFRLSIATSAGAFKQSTDWWYGTGNWTRKYTTWTADASATFRFNVLRRSSTSTDKFYVDGWQVEAKRYPTTYCDGDQKGFVINQRAYWWNGTPGASTSSRSAQTRAGGKEVNLLDFGFHVLAIIGLGMAGMVEQSLPIPGLGELPQGTGTAAREFTLVSSVNGQGDSGRHLQAQLATFEDAIKPDLVTPDQPLILRFQACDYEGLEIGELVDIQCKYRGGLEGNWDNHQQARVALNFKQYVPFIQSSYDTGSALGYQTAVANANFIIERTPDGIWQAMGAGLNGVVASFIKDNSGSLILGGNFTTVGSHIASWNGSAFGTLSGGTNGNVAALAITPSGILYAGGLFTLADGVANTKRIAKWDGAVWTSLSNGIDDSGVSALLYANDGKLYIGGGFTAASGVANTAKICYWNGATYVTLGNANASVFTLAQSNGVNNEIYAGGAFTVIGGNNINYVAKWNGLVWSEVGSGGANGPIYKLAFGTDKRLYAIGDFTVIGGVNANKIAVWNGTSWAPLSTGTTGTLLGLAISPSGDVYVSGIIGTTGIGGVIMPGGVAIWNGSVWYPVDVDLPGGTANPLYFLDNGTLFIGFDINGTAYSATVTVPNIPSATAYPIITFTGPGTTWQLKNYTTGKSIFFDSLTLLAGETAVLNLDPMHVSFVSSFRGNIMGSILKGSNLNFPLLPGNNNISAYMYGSTTAATDLKMQWRGRYWSTEGTIWR